MGPHTLEIPMSLHKLNRERLCAALKQKDVSPKAMVLLQGGSEFQRYDTDVDIAAFRQVSFPNFYVVS